MTDTAAPTAPGTVAPPSGDRRVLTAQRSVVGSLVAEAVAGAVLVSCSVLLGGEAAVAVALVTGAGLLLARVWLGAVRAGVAGAVGWGALTVLQLGLLTSAMGDVGDGRVVAALTGVSVIPFVAGLAGAVPMRGVHTGDRDDLTPALLVVAVSGGVGVLAAMGVASVLDVDDARFGLLAPYVAAGMAVLALVEVLAHHRVGAGFPETAALVTSAAVGLMAVLLLVNGTAPLDDSVIAVVVGTGGAAVGLLGATAVATPRPLVVPVEEADGGPRQVAWILGGLLAVAAALRLLSLRPFWLDEALTARTTEGSLAATLTSARDADAHPPLLNCAVWLCRQVAGGGELALRGPSLVAGVLLVPAIYVTAAKLYDRRVGLVAATVSAVGPGLMWLSGTARPGMLGALLATLGLLTMLRAIERGRLVDWVLLGLAAAALVWAHQLGFLHSAVLVVAAGVLLWRRGHGGASETQPAPDWLGWAVALLITAAAFVALVVYRGGVGPPTVLTPLEYATPGAPGAGRSVLGLTGTALIGLVGFHPEDVTSRLLALWPLSILATFALAVRTWSWRGVLLLTLAATPFVALLVAQVAGAPRDPPFALEWTATAVPMVAIGVGRAAGLAARWPRVRLAGLAVAGVLAIAAVDQAARVRPEARFDVTPAVQEAADEAKGGDTVVYAPAALGDLVRYEEPDAHVVSVSGASSARLDDARRVVIIGGFGFGDEETQDQVLALVDDLAADRRLLSETEHGDTKVWSFG